MKLGILLNACALILGFAGAGLVWWAGRKEGPGLPFYADAKGEILKTAAAEDTRRQWLKDRGIALVAISFLLQFFALFV
jgi:hypothetical protein